MLSVISGIKPSTERLHVSAVQVHKLSYARFHLAFIPILIKANSTMFFTFMYKGITADSTTNGTGAVAMNDCSKFLFCLLIYKI